MLLQIVLFIIGLGLVVKGADWLVDGSSAIAKRLGISDFVIGLTIVGMGTSAPELVVSFIGAIQGNADIAIGNVIGSNIFNVLLILGVTAIICPMAITKINRRKDIPINIGITVLLLVLGMTHTLFGFGNDTLSRVDGLLFLVLFAIYIYMSFRFDTADDEAEDDGKKISKALSIFMIVGGLASLVFGGQLFVDSATKIAKMMGVSDKFIAITILAGGTSMPELATCIEERPACSRQYPGLQCFQYLADPRRLRIDSSIVICRNKPGGRRRIAVECIGNRLQHLYIQERPA